MYGVVGLDSPEQSLRKNLNVSNPLGDTIPNTGGWSQNGSKGLFSEQATAPQENTATRSQGSRNVIRNHCTSEQSVEGRAGVMFSCWLPSAS